jgi:SPP1 family predicted phage head-tail adaptor
MQIGPLRHRVTLEQPPATPSQDAHGAEIITYTVLATVWAQVLPATGQERFVSAGDRQLAALTHKVRVRYRTDLSPLMIVRWEGRVLDIESIQDPTGKRGYLELMCREVVS